jgi:hypothetical protein
MFEGGDAKIVAEVRHEMAIAQGEVIELDDSDSEVKGDNEDLLPRREVMKLCEVLEKMCLRYGDLYSSIELPHHLQRYRAQVQQANLLNCTQASLDGYFT